MIAGLNRSTVYYGLGVVMMKGIALLMLPIYTQFLSTSEYGQLEILITVSHLASLLLGFGLVESLYRFAGGKGLKQQQVIFANIMYLAMIIAVAITISLNIFANQIVALIPGELAASSIRYLSISLGLGMAINLPLTWFRMKDRAGEFFVVSLMMAVLQSLGSYLLLQMDYGVMSIILSGVMASVITTLYLVVRLRQEIKSLWRPRLFKYLLRYGWPFVMSGFAGFLLAGADRWLLAEATSLELLASYAIAAKFAFVPVMLLQPYSLWWYPKRFSLLEGHDNLIKNAKFAMLGAIYAVLLCGLTGLVAPFVIRWLTPEAYHSSIQLLPWFLTAIAMKLCSEYLNIGCFIAKQSYQQMVIETVSSVTGLLLMLFFVTSHGVMGILFALNIAYLIRLVLFFGLSQQKLRLPYKLKPLFTSVMMGILLLGLGQKGILW